MPRRQPRWPSIGLNSCSSSTRLQQFGQLLLQIARLDAVLLRHLLLHRLAGVRQPGEIHHQVFALGQELVQRRIERADHHRESVHGLEQAGEILALHGQQLLQRLACAIFSSRARIMACMCGMRSSAKNMCSVRHRPMPSAPNSRATLASRGMSALARTPKLPRNSSAHVISLPKYEEVGSGSLVSALPR